MPYWGGGGYLQSTGVAFIGSGDVISGALGWWGLRAYTVASIGGNAIRLREDGGNTEQDFATIAGGGLDLAAITTFKGVNNLFVVKLYDQTGGLHHMVQATAAQQPAFTLSGLGSLPIMTCVRASNQGLRNTGATITQAQPFSASGVAQRTGDFSFYGAIITSDDDVGGIFFRNSPDSIAFFSTSQNIRTAPDNVWYAVQMSGDGLNSVMSLDGAYINANLGTTGIINTQSVGYDGAAADSLSGNWGEAGLWPFAFTPQNCTDMSRNQHTYWGF